MRKKFLAYLLAFTFLLLFATARADAMLSWGSRGETVQTLQTKLKNWGYYQGAIDGVYGQSTYEAVRAFQRKNGLTIDGVVGAKTAMALGLQLSKGPSSTNVSSDTQLLAHLVYAEARGEPYVGQVAVAAVVLNRVQSAKFPNTIAGVIYQTGAFDCVYDGQINLNPDATALRAAKDALNGWDPTGGCLYYYNPATSTSSWIWSRSVQTSIGSHAFAL